MFAPARSVGIDVSKAWLDVAVRPDGRTFRVANDASGWNTLVSNLQAQTGPVVIVLEASGGYEAGVVLALDAAGMTPAVVNPLATRRFAQSLGKRGKTDRLDAAMLAEYAERMAPRPQPIAAETARQLNGLLTRRRQLTKLLVEEKNHLPQTLSLLRAQVAASIDCLTDQRAEIDALIASTVAADPTWQAKIDQLASVPGIGLFVATTLAVQLPELGTCTAKEAAALVGVAPFPKESGLLRGQRHISAGRGAVRQALYLAVMATKRWDPTFKAHFDQLRARGKTHKQAMIACIRRLLGILTAMLRDDLTWDQTNVGRGQFLAHSA